MSCEVMVWSVKCAVESYLGVCSFVYLIFLEWSLVMLYDGRLERTCDSNRLEVSIFSPLHLWVGFSACDTIHFECQGLVNLVLELSQLYYRSVTVTNLLLASIRIAIVLDTPASP